MALVHIELDEKFKNNLSTSITLKAKLHPFAKGGEREKEAQVELHTLRDAIHKLLKEFEYMED